MSLLFDAVRLERALRDFYFATGAPIDFLKPDETSVNVKLYGLKEFCDKIRFTREGRARCAKDNGFLVEECNRTHDTVVQVCHAGLIHAMVPVMADDEIVGYLAIGRFRVEREFLPSNPISDLPLDYIKMRNAYFDLRENDQKWLESMLCMAKIFASYLVSDKIIKVVKNDNLERVRAYIESNLSEDLSIDKISAETNISRSVLYRNFSYHHGMTVSEYINLRRSEEAVGLLMKTDLSVDEIARKVGFASATYFVSVFKRLKGMTPLQFRKKNYLKVD